MTLLNLTKPKPKDLDTGFTVVQGNALDMHMFADKQFDIVYSNSVIEHVGSYANQSRFAAEVRRVGKSYWVQTPSRFFPVEPHFMFPFFQFLPGHVQRQIALSWRYSHFKRFGVPRERILDELSTIRLLSIREVMSLFGSEGLYREMFLGLPKSYVAFKKG
ncbi:MAG: methyltransferase domain-containing protein [Balneolaceae bacterium]|nr:MAG: methyltransferase domain-containing protein [Balneolaceae bacterium]